MIQSKHLLAGRIKTCAGANCPFAHALRLKGVKPGMSAQKHVFTLYKRKAKDRKQDFELTEEVFFALISHNCHYCGSAPANISKRERGSGTFTYNGIDRIDSKIGYILGNVRSCCWLCNRMKNSLTEGAFFDHLNRIIDYRKYKQAA